MEKRNQKLYKMSEEEIAAKKAKIAIKRQDEEYLNLLEDDDFEEDPEYARYMKDSKVQKAIRGK